MVEEERKKGRERKMMEGEIRDGLVSSSAPRPSICSFFFVLAWNKKREERAGMDRVVEEERR